MPPIELMAGGVNTWVPLLENEPMLAYVPLVGSYQRAVTVPRIFARLMIVPNIGGQVRHAPRPVGGHGR
jgi:hypothetical protein